MIQHIFGEYIMAKRFGKKVIHMSKKVVFLMSIVCMFVLGVSWYYLASFPIPFLPIPVTSSEKILTIYNWEDYFAPHTIADFEKKYSVNVTLETFKSESEAIAALQSNPLRYDLVVLSNTVIKEFMTMKTFAPLDFTKIENIKNLDPWFNNRSYDAENIYTVPYLWGTTGIVINQNYVKEKVTSWNALWNKKYAGKIGMLDESWEVLGAGLKAFEFPLNSRDPLQLEQAFQKLKEQQPLLRGYFDPMTLLDQLREEHIWLAQCYSGEALRLQEEDERFAYSIPREGGTIWIDNFVIPARAPHKTTAELFINYILEPEVHAAIASYVGYASPNSASKAFLPTSMLNNKNMYPDEIVKSKLEFIDASKFDLPQYNKIWNELKVSV